MKFTTIRQTMLCVIGWFVCTGWGAAFGQNVQAPVADTLPASAPMAVAQGYYALTLPGISLLSSQTALTAAVAKALGSEESSLAVLTDKRTPGGRHVRYAQRHASWGVYGGQLVVNLWKGGRATVSDARRKLPTGLQPGAVVAPKAVQALYVPAGPKPFGVAAEWQFWQGQFIPVYRFITAPRPDEPRSFDVVVAARTGQLLAVHDRGVHFMPGDTLGFATVFNPDPLTTAGTTYGGSYADNNDQTNDLLDAQLQSVELLEVEWVNDSVGCRLHGPHVKLEDIGGPQNSVPEALDCDFSVTRDHDEFEAAMSYYHIDTYQRYLQSIGYDSLYRRPLRVDPRGFTADNSAVYPGGLNTYMLLGIGGVDDAEDADVILHEYGHALSEDAAPASNTGTLRRGIDEGIGDYIAASYSQALNRYRWSDVFTWDGHNTFWAGRTADGAITKSTANLSNIYSVGTLWATAMMDVHDALGREIADKLVMEMLYGLVPNMTLEANAQLILDAELALFNATHHETVKQLLCFRELLLPADCQSVSLPNPENTSQELQVFYHPTEQALRVHWPKDSNCYQASVRVLDVLGRELTRVELTHPQSRIELPAAASQLILVQTKTSCRTEPSAQRIWVP